MRKTRRGRRKEIGMAVLLTTAVFVLMVWLRPWSKGEEVKVVNSVPEVTAAPKIRRALDGVWVAKEEADLPLAGVMIENMVEAQPLSGIADAILVFEAVTEANITRFLAYFVLEGEIAIGAVRSARPYFLDWAVEFNTVFAHVGGSPAAAERLRSKGGVEGVQDLDQWYKSEYFVRKDGRAKPHHIYTSSTALLRAFKERELEPKYGMWKFKNDASPDLRGNVTDITVSYVAPYAVQWLYDKFENHYKRMQWSGVHKDENGKEIIAKNIAVAFQEMKVLDGVGRKEFTTLGEGKGLVFQDGRVVVGTWKKPLVSERMRFYDAQGSEVEFNAGTTWIEIVPKEYGVKY